MPEETTEPQGLQFHVKQTTIMPVGINCAKIDTPEGTVVLLSVLEGVPVGPQVIPLSETTIKLAEPQARELIDLISKTVSGLYRAAANELPK